MATHSTIFGWRIPWTEEPCRMQSTDSQGVGGNWVCTPTLWYERIKLSKTFWESWAFLSLLLDYSLHDLLWVLKVQFSCSVLSDTLWPHALQHARLPCPLPTPRACSNSCPSSQWCHPTSSSSIVPFSSCLQSFPASGSFPMSQFFPSGGQSIGVSASASVLPMNIQDWFPLEWTGWISWESKGLSRVFSNTINRKCWFFRLSFLYSPTLTSIHDYWKNHSFDQMDLCQKSNVCAF